MPSSDSSCQMPICHGVDIEEMSIQALGACLSNRSFSSEDLTQCYLERIRKLDHRIKAVIETNPDALAIAYELDAERRNGKVRSKLHGIPFLVKDNISTKDKMETTAGSAALVGTKVPNDAPVVSILRDAGGILLGKANLSEWASMRATYYAEGYSSRGGQNRNPYNLAEHAGGSSSGSASSVAANMCAFSIGTETDTSVIFPADRNAVVGIKPTVGLTSTVGVIPEAPSLDTVGVFGRSVADAAAVLDIIADRDSIPESFRGALESSHRLLTSSQPYSACLKDRQVLKGARFGLPWKRVWQTASKSLESRTEYEALRRLTQEMKRAGAKLYDVEIPSAESIIPPDGWNWEYADGHLGSKLSEFEVVKFEFPPSLRSYLNTIIAIDERKIRSLEDVAAYNIEHTEQEGGIPGTHPAWPTGQDNFDRCIESKHIDKAAYKKALTYIRRESRERGIDSAMKLEGDGILDGLLVPIQADGGVACSVAAKAGYPMITIPLGVNDIGVPFGIGIIQMAWQESLLVKYGSAIEDLIRDDGRGRKRPTFLNFNADNYLYVGNPPPPET